MLNAIYMSDLAQAYFPRSTPRSASAQLHRWIKLNPELQHEAIVELLGEPGE